MCPQQLKAVSRQPNLKATPLRIRRLRVRVTSNICVTAACCVAAGFAAVYSCGACSCR